MILLSFSCKKEASILGAKDFYVAGYQADNNFTVARYWKNGVATSITDGSKASTIYSIVVDGNDVYATGNEGNKAMYWKNGVGTELTDGWWLSYGTCISVSNGDVYVTGTERDQTTLEYVNKYWKNGQAMNAPYAYIHLFNTSIIARGTDLYLIGGNFNGTKKVAYTKNGVHTYYPETNDHSTIVSYSMAVHNSDVYISGAMINSTTNKKVACYWKNNQVFKLPVDSTINSTATNIAISGNTVHLAGDIDGVPTYWKNKVATKLADRGWCNSIAAYGNDVLISGNISDGFNTPVATYWKNGVSYNVSNGGNQIFARAVFLSQ